MSRATALRFGALLHDIGKPATRSERDGFVGFRGHDAIGAEIVAEICARLRASRALTRHLEGLTLHHLRLGFLIPEAPLPPRRVHEYLRATEPVAASTSPCSRSPTASPPAAPASLARPRWSRRTSSWRAKRSLPALDWRRDGPPRAARAAAIELARELGIPEGPELGEALAELEAAQYAGEVGDREAAIAHARDWIGRSAQDS